MVRQMHSFNAQASYIGIEQPADLQKENRHGQRQRSEPA